MSALSIYLLVLCSGYLQIQPLNDYNWIGNPDAFWNPYSGCVLDVFPTNSVPHPDLVDQRVPQRGTCFPTSFSCKRLMTNQFNLISTLRGVIESLLGPSATSKEARAQLLLKWRGSLVLQMVDGKAKQNYQPPRQLFPLSIPNRQMGVAMSRDWRISMLNSGCMRLVWRVCS